MQVLGASLTYRTTCRSCNAAVWFHTNGNGDAVFFDDLGWPWAVHSCYLNRLPGSGQPGYGPYRAYMVQKYGAPPKAAPKRSHAQIAKAATPAPKAQIRNPAGQTFDIVRCDPELYTRKRLDVVGFVQESHEDRSVARLAPSGSIAHGMLHKVMGDGHYSQVTIIDGDLVSYTFRIPLPNVNLKAGEMITVVLERTVIPGLPAFYLCRSLSLVDLKPKGN